MKYSVLAQALVGATVVVGLPSGLPGFVGGITQSITDSLNNALAPIFHPVTTGRVLVPLEEAQTKYAAWPKFNHSDPNHEWKDFASHEELEFKIAYHQFETRQQGTSASCNANPNVRYEWDDYSTSDRQALMAAFKCMMNKPSSGKFAPSTSRWEDFARLHQSYTPQVHGNAKFTLWHRYFLWTFEQTLRSECGFNRAFVWFDETKHAGAFAGSDLFSAAYLGSLPGSQQCVTNGAFAGLTTHIGPGSGESTQCLTRKGNAQDTAQCSTGYINYCNGMADYKNWETCLENGPHGYGHNGVGGTMSDVYASPEEPFFYFHHAFVDRAYRIWQLADNPARYNTIDGVDAKNVGLTLNTPIYMGGIRPDTTVGEVINTLSGETICYRYNY